MRLSHLASALTTPWRVVVAFDQVDPWHHIKSKIGLAQNLNSLGQGLEGLVATFSDLGIAMFSGACEFDTWYKNPGTINPCLNATYDGAGRALTMTTTPTATATNYVASVNAADIVMGMQLIGPIPEQQIATTFEPRRHPVPIDIAAHCLKVATWIKAVNWPAPIKWSLWNEFMRTMLDCKQGKNLDGTSFVESDAAYYIRRASLKDQAVAAFVQLYLGTFSLAGTKDIGKWSTASPGSLLSGDTKTGDGRTMSDGRTGRQGVLDAIAAQILTASQVTMPSDFTDNDFGNRSPNILGNQSDFNGANYPQVGNQGGPGSLKASTSDEGGEDQDPAADTRMGPACEMMGMFKSDWRTPQRFARCYSFTLGAQDAFWSNDGLGGYIERWRGTTLRKVMAMPSRACVVRNVLQDYVADNSVLRMQGVQCIAGVDPGGQTAQVMLWNEQPYPVTILLDFTGLPANLSGVTPTYHRLQEDNAAGEFLALPGRTLTMGPQSIHTFRWENGTSPELRRKPLADGTYTPKFLANVVTYARPKGAGARFDQVRGLGLIQPSSTSGSKLVTGAAWQQLPDTVWLTCWVHALDAPANTLKAYVDYGTGDVTVWSTTCGAVTAGQVVALDVIGNAPGGWSAGTREAKITVEHNGAATHRVEFWVSGTLAKANAIKGA